MDKVVHFEIPMDEPARAKKFYADCFGWQINDIPELNYTLVSTTETDENQMPKTPGSINGGMFQRDPSMPNIQVHIKVADMDAALKKIEEEGGEVIRGKSPVADMGFVANFKDSEGNILGLWQDA